MHTTNVQLSGGLATVAYDVTGTGPAVVLIHGTGGDRSQWSMLAGALADRYTVLALDYSGSGDTVDHGGPLTLPDLAAEVHAAVNDAGIDKFHLVGNSLGAVIAAQVAATDPERVRSLVMHAGWVCTDTRMDAEFRYWLELLRVDAEHGTALFPEHMLLIGFGPNYWAQVSAEDNAAVLKQLIDGIARGAARQTEVDRTVDLTDLLGRITAPTLLLASTYDRIVPAAQQQQLLAAIADAHYAEIDAGHGAPFEDPEAFNGKIIGFLDSQMVA